MMGNDIIIQSIAFGERMVEITYSEPRDQASDQSVMMVRSIAISIDVASEEIEELIDSASQLVDLGLLRVRNPEDAKPRRPRA